MNLELRKYVLEKAIEISNSDYSSEDVIKKAEAFLKFLQVAVQQEGILDKG